MKVTVEEILDLMPPQTRFSEADSAVILAHKDILLELGQSLVESFYQTVLTHAPTAAIFRPDEMEERVRSLSSWWRRTCEGPHDRAFFAWQLFVGLIHIKRGVRNPMVIALWSHLLVYLSTHLSQRLDAAQAAPVLCSLQRLATTIQALITEGYLQNYIEILGNSTGMSTVLLDRLVMTRIDDVLNQYGQG